MVSEEIEKLAETLKNSGLAASMKDAIEKAEKMLGKKEPQKEEIQTENEAPADQTTLTQVKEPTQENNAQNGANSESKEEVFEKPKEEPVKKKVDLTDIFNVNK